MKYLLTSFLLSLLLLACQSPATTTTPAVTGNPAAPGFLADSSDPRAIEIADQVMEASGGRANWDAVDTLHWNFFGMRELIWNKTTGDVTITSEKEKYEMNINILTDEGSVIRNGEKVTNTDSLKIFLNQAKEIWINDSYWLAMPFKLKDSGVQLKYIGDGMTQDSMAAEVLELTFQSVGVTPENKYLVYVDKKSNLVSQWDFYAKANDPKPRFSMPWKGYKKIDGILLSEDRGPRRIDVYD